MFEQTFAMVKSHALYAADDIFVRSVRAGLIVFSTGVARQLSEREAAELYFEHAGRTYYDSLIRSVTQGPVMCAILSGDNAIICWRRLLGPTDPEKAPPGCIRGDFGCQMPDNAAHGSDSHESAKREICIIFPEYEYIGP